MYVMILTSPPLDLTSGAPFHVLSLVGSVLIFVSRKNGVVELTENLKNAGIKCKSAFSTRKEIVEV